MFKKITKALKTPKEDSKQQNGLKAATNGNDSGGTLALHDAASLHEAELHPDAHEEGGLSCNNMELLKEQQQAITEWIKSMGKRLFTGSFNLISTPMPVIMFEPRSYLEKLADVWVYPRYLRMASETNLPLERMKLVITWFVAGLHHGFEKWKKPFNPILGETWQASLSDGSSMFMEQISHHPPVSAFHLEGPGGKYRFRGLSQPNVSLVVKHYGFKTVAKGYRYVEFADGSRIDIQYPGYYIKGVVYSSRPRAEVDGAAVFVDARNQLKAVIRFGANKGARAPALRRTDAIVGEVYDVAGSSTVGTAPSMPAVYEGVGEDASTSDGESARNTGGGAGEGDDSEAFESASETDWDLRELREAAEAAQREGEASVPASAAALTVLQTSGRPSIVGHVTATSSLLAGGSSGAPVASSSAPPHASRSSVPELAGMGNTSGACTSNDGAGPDVARRGSEPGAGAGAGTSGMKRDASTASTNSGTLFSGFSGFGKMMGFSSSSMASSGSADVVDDVAGAVLARVEGSWLSHLNIDGQRYWTLATERPDTWQPASAGVLPSDARFRNDLVVLKDGDVKGSQQWKELLENVQRRDKKLREQATGKPH